MTSIQFAELYSRFYLKIEAYDLFDQNMTDDMRDEFLCGYIHSTLSKPYLRRLFSSIKITDPYTEEVENPDYNPNEPESKPTITHKIDGSIDAVMKYVVDDDADRDFVIEAVAMGMVLVWAESKVKSLTTMRRMVGTADEKFFSESTFLTALESIRASIDTEQHNLIQNRGFINNEYLDGNSASASLRG